MKHLKIISIISILIFQFVTAKAQPGDDYKTSWDKVKQLEKKGLTRDALTEVIKIFDAANKAGNQSQQVKAAMYQMKYRNMVEEDNRENNIFYLDTLITKTKAPAKNILQSMQAELFASYRRQNQYRLYDRTQLAAEKSNDITTWSIEKLNATIARLYKASLQNESILKATSLNGFDDIINKGKNSRNLRPTLYDLLAHRALDYFMSDENSVTDPSYHFILNNEKAFAPVKEFVQTKFVTADTIALQYQSLLLLQDILKFHLNDGNKDALLDADLKRLAFVNEHGVFSNKRNLYLQALEAIERNYSGNENTARAMHLRAQEYVNMANEYQPLKNNDHQFDLQKAITICEDAIRQYPSSEGAVQCKNLMGQIKTPSLNLETEKVNVPNAPFRTLVKYKNVPTLYLRIIKTSHDALKKLQTENNGDPWPSLVKMQALKIWNVALPDLKDFQEHAAEIKIDALPVGTYMILASTKPGFDLGSNIIARQVTYVSNISYIYNNKDQLYVLDRDNGLPLADAVVQLWEQRYNYQTRQFTSTKKEKYTSNKNGLIKINLPNNRQENYLEFSYKNDELFTDDNYYNYNYDGYRRQTQRRTFLFTDRSIYRPGQTVFFKGIVIRTDTSGRKSDLVTGFETSVRLMDANGQKIQTAAYTTNSYGSYSGSFKLPEGGLNGQFYIMDSTTNSSQYFSVEEYKRPKFLTEIKKPEGTYRVNDTIAITGNAKAYAGNNIDGAKVVYRVVRRVRYPIWWYGGYTKIFPPYGRQEAMEITNGATTTDVDGNFTIRFKAIPDETVDKKDQPTFYYEVSADVTDINGETRSGETTVAVAYQALQLAIEVPAKLPSDSLSNIKITSKNLNDLFEKSTVTLAMYALQEPNRIFRNRFWQQPDQFTMSRPDYYASFPYDVYADENDPSKWPIGNKVLELKDTTSKNGNWNFESKKVAPGYYKIVITTIDKYGETVKAEKIMQLFDEKKPAANEPILVSAKNKRAEPGEKIQYSVYTGFDKIWLIQNLLKTGTADNVFYETVSNSNSFSNIIPVTDEDRGGINLDYIFVKHNRVYNGAENFIIPWSNKELKIEYETFRDKILPGSEENWKLTIKGSKGEKVAAEMLVNMYDASLDQFKPHNWQMLSSIWPTNTGRLNWWQTDFTGVSSDEKNSLGWVYEDTKPIVYDALVNEGWNEGYYNPGIMLRGRVSGVDIQAMSAAPVAGQKENMNADNQKLADVVVGYGATKKTDTVAFNVNERKAATNNPSIQIRKNFNETAFFFPQLKTDADGNISFNFTIPEALTEWKLMTMAHTSDLASGYDERTVITQKPLMVQPNGPRFLREGDAMELVTKVVNLSDKEITGTVQLELINAMTNAPVDGWFKNVFPNQYFTVEAGKSAAVKFPMEVPFNFNSALTYRVKAISNDKTFSDGEENLIPVLSNRMLVTETLPLNMRNTNSKQFTFEKLLNSSPAGGGREGATLTNHSLTVEYTSNPAWYAVQALPYLMEYPYECAEQNFNRYYANVLAAFVANSTPRIKAVFEKWKTLDTAALMSNLQKNEELKSALLAETPWVLEAENEQQQKKNIGILFDMARLGNEKAATLNKLKEMQSSNGGFTWFKGGPDDRYITQYIITGIGHLRKLNAFTATDYTALKPIVDKALPYLDARLKDEYDNLIKYKAKLSANNLSNAAIQYLYMRSFFPENTVNANAATAVNYFKNQAATYWLSQNKYMQGMIALALHRNKDAKTPKAIIASLKQNAIYKEEMGMYWKEYTTGGYYWYQAPIESQAMMIEAFTDIDGTTSTINDLKTWLLKQKQVQNWKTTKATAEACYALLLNGSNWLAEEKEVIIQLGTNTTITSAGNAEAGTGYFKQTINGTKITPAMGNITVSIRPSQANPAKGGGSSTSWGAAYWQYFEDLDKITSAATPLSLVKKLYIEKNSDRGPVLHELKEGETLKIGDKVKVRIELKVDRNMEYIHMKDMRAAGMEPVNVLSQYKWQGGLGYYESTLDASTNFFFAQLPRGSYVFEYPLFVAQAGNFSNGITSIQCMYAPEFSSHSEGVRVTVE